MAQHPGAYFTAKVQTWEAVLFLGASMCITAFPMLGRIIVERGLAGTSLGTLALAAGAMDDTAAWCLLAAVLASFQSDPVMALEAIGIYAVFGAVIVGFCLPRKVRRLLGSGPDPRGRAAHLAGLRDPDECAGVDGTDHPEHRV